jgi:hypothetical protein
VEQVVHRPLEEVGEDEEDEELGPEGPMGDRRAVEGEPGALEQTRGLAGDPPVCPGGQEREDVTVEREKAQVPEPPGAKEGLVPAPGEEPLEDDEGEGDADQPVEVGPGSAE